MQNPPAYPHELPPSPPTPKLTHVLFDIGYLGLKDPHALPSIVRSLHALLIDCRFSPRSRIPQYRGIYLAQQLGNQYTVVPQLGNRNYKEHEKPFAIVDLAKGLEIVYEHLQHRPVILMCACANRMDCHRLFLTDSMEFVYGIRTVPLTNELVTGMLNLGQMLAEGN